MDSPLTIVYVYMGLGGLATILYILSTYLENKENNTMATETNKTVNVINLTVNPDLLAIFPLLTDLNVVMVAYYIRKTDSPLAGFNGGLVASRIVYHLFKAQETNPELDVDSAIIALSAMYEQSKESMQKDGKYEHLATQAGIVAWCKEMGFIPQAKTLPIADMPHKAGIAAIQDKINNLRNKINPMVASTTPPMPSQAKTLLDNVNPDIAVYPQGFSMFGNEYKQSDLGLLADGTIKYTGGVNFVDSQVKVNDTLTIGDSVYTVTKILYKGKNLNLRYTGKSQAATPTLPVQTPATQAATPASKTRKGKTQSATLPVQTPATQAATPASDIESRMSRLESMLAMIADKLT